MTSVKKQYIKEMKKRYGGYHATWAPGVPLQVGDIGTFDNDGGFSKIANLANLNIPFEICPDEAGDQLDYSSQGSSSVTAKLSGAVAPNGSVLAEGDAGIIVEFSKTNSILFKAKDVTYPSINNQIQLEKDIIELYKNGKWKKEWCVITELAVAESATIIISNSANSRIELKANANLEAATINIADAAFNFSIQSARNLNTTIIAQGGVTPLFIAKKLNFKKGLFKPTTLAGFGIQRMYKTVDFGIKNDNSAKEEEIISLVFVPTQEEAED